jgi:Tfp pilus assembly protein FimT
MRKMPSTCIRQRKLLNSRGFSTLELLFVVAIGLVLAGFAIPGYASMSRYLRISGDARVLNGVIAEAKMRAAQDFTHARVYVDLAANTYHLEYWSKGANCWKTDGDAVNRCTAAGTSPVQPLSTGVTFGFGTVGAALPNPQTVIAQAPACLNGVAGGASLGTAGNTACIEFNSRGIPVAASGSPTANDALYLTDQNSIYGITVISSGLIQDWSSPATSTAWTAR